MWEQLLGRGRSIPADGAWHLHGMEVFLTGGACSCNTESSNCHPGWAVQRTQSPLLWPGSMKIRPADAEQREASRGFYKVKEGAKTGRDTQYKLHTLSNPP